jgi:hypothetical protein
MERRSSIKRRKPADINQLAKSIVDLATGNPILEDLPVELKKRSLSVKQREDLKDNESRMKKLSSNRQTQTPKKSTQAR